MYVPDTWDEALTVIRSMAGLKSGGGRGTASVWDTPVTVIPGSLTPPTLIHRGAQARSRWDKNSTKRTVEVGEDWIRTQAPELWAAFVAKKLGGER